MFSNDSCCQESYEHVAKNKKYTAISQMKKNTVFKEYTVLLRYFYLLVYAREGKISYKISGHAHWHYTICTLFTRFNFFL